MEKEEPKKSKTLLRGISLKRMRSTRMSKEYNIHKSSVMLKSEVELTSYKSIGDKNTLVPYYSQLESLRDSNLIDSTFDERNTNAGKTTQETYTYLKKDKFDVTQNDYTTTTGSSTMECTDKPYNNFNRDDIPCTSSAQPLSKGITFCENCCNWKRAASCENIISKQNYSTHKNERDEVIFRTATVPFLFNDTEEDQRHVLPCDHKHGTRYVFKSEPTMTSISTDNMSIEVTQEEKSRKVSLTLICRLSQDTEDECAIVESKLIDDKHVSSNPTKLLPRDNCNLEIGNAIERPTLKTDKQRTDVIPKVKSKIKPKIFPTPKPSRQSHTSVQKDSSKPAVASKPVKPSIKSHAFTQKNSVKPFVPPKPAKLRGKVSPYIPNMDRQRTSDTKQVSDKSDRSRSREDKDNAKVAWGLNETSEKTLWHAHSTPEITNTSLGHSDVTEAKRRITHVNSAEPVGLPSSYHSTANGASKPVDLVQSLESALLQKYRKLSCCDPDNLIPYLLQHKVITLGDREKIDAIKTETSQMEKLLNILLKKQTDWSVRLVLCLAESEEVGDNKLAERICDAAGTSLRDLQAAYATEI